MRFMCLISCLSGAELTVLLIQASVLLFSSWFYSCLLNFEKFITVCECISTYAFHTHMKVKAQLVGVGHVGPGDWTGHQAYVTRAFPGWVILPAICLLSSSEFHLKYAFITYLLLPHKKSSNFNLYLKNHPVTIVVFKAMKADTTLSTCWVQPSSWKAACTARYLGSLTVLQKVIL